MNIKGIQIHSCINLIAEISSTLKFSLVGIKIAVHNTLGSFYRELAFSISALMSEEMHFIDRSLQSFSFVLECVDNSVELLSRILTQFVFCKDWEQKLTFK